MRREYEFEQTDNAQCDGDFSGYVNSRLDLYFCDAAEEFGMCDNAVLVVQDYFEEGFIKVTLKEGSFASIRGEERFLDTTTYNYLRRIFKTATLFFKIVPPEEQTP